MNLTKITFASLFLLLSLSSIAQEIDSTAYHWFADAEVYQNQKNTTAADSVLHLAIDAFEVEENWEMVLKCRRVLALAKQKNNDLEGAVADFKKIAEESRQRFGEGHAAESSAYYFQGIIYRELANFKDAVIVLKKSLEMRQAELGPDHQLVAHASMQYGRTILQMTKHEEALYHFENGLRIYLLIGGESMVYASDAYADIANIYSNIGEYYKTLQYNEKSLAILKKVKGDRTFREAISLNNIGNVHSVLGHHEVANELYRSCLDILKEVVGETHPYVSFGVGNYGLSLRQLGRHDEAMKAFEEAIKIEELHYGENPPQSANTYLNIGITKRDQGLLEESLEWGIKGQKALHASFGLRHPYACKNYINLAITEGQLENFDRALEYCRKGFNAILVNLKDTCAVAPHLKYAQTTDDAEEYLRAFYIQGQLLHKRYLKNGSIQDLEDAYESFNISDGIISKVRRTKSDDEAAAYNKIAASIMYPEMMAITLARYEKSRAEEHLERAFYFAEKNKASILLQSSSGSMARKFSNIPEKLLNKELELKEKITIAEGELLEAVTQNNKEAIAEIRDARIFEASNQLDDLLKKIEEEYPDYIEMKYSSKIAGLNDIQSILNDKTLVLEYVINARDNEDCLDKTKPELYAFAIDKNQTQQYRLKWSEQIVKDITELHRLSQKTSITKSKNRKRFIALSHQLYQQLIQPMESMMNGKKRLVIISDGALFYLPFELLLKSKEVKSFKDLDYLVKDYDVSYHYSATLFKKSCTTVNSETDRLLAFAPVFGTDGEDIEYSNEDTRSWPDSMFQGLRDGRFVPLYWSEKEVNNINRMFASKGVSNNTILLHDKASEKSLKKYTNESYKYIHVASHSFSNLEQPRFSGIACSINSSGDEEDGILYVGEIYNLSLNADLVVLSSCESGIGKLLGGEGMLGINRSFMYAGTPNIVYSLWKVNDEKSSQLMTAFYKNMLEGDSYSRALRKAKLELLEEETTALPVYWSPFVLIGR